MSMSGYRKELAIFSKINLELWKIWTIFVAQLVNKPKTNNKWKQQIYHALSRKLPLSMRYVLSTRGLREHPY